MNMKILSYRFMFDKKFHSLISLVHKVISSEKCYILIYFKWKQVMYKEKISQLFNIYRIWRWYFSRRRQLSWDKQNNYAPITTILFKIYEIQTIKVWVSKSLVYVTLGKSIETDQIKHDEHIFSIQIYCVAFNVIPSHHNIFQNFF